jgi:hypothetical protein
VDLQRKSGRIEKLVDRSRKWDKVEGKRKKGRILDIGRLNRIDRNIIRKKVWKKRPQPNSHSSALAICHYHRLQTDGQAVIALL